MDTSEIRPSVLWFAGQMETKLRENEHKGNWTTRPDGDLLVDLEGEVVELEDSIALQTNPTEIIKEAADVANFAMMIATKHGEIPWKPGRG